MEALYEVVDLCDLLSFINTIVRAAGMEPPEAITQQPSAGDLWRACVAMEDAIKS